MYQWDGDIHNFVNFAEILFECEGKDVGVMTCGPRKMRHEVARICSSGLADNLHFESISFNWWSTMLHQCTCRIYMPFTILYNVHVDSSML